MCNPHLLTIHSPTHSLCVAPLTHYAQPHPPTHIGESCDEHTLSACGRHCGLLELLEAPNGVASRNDHHIGHVAAVRLLHLNGQLLNQYAMLDLQTDPVLEGEGEREGEGEGEGGRGGEDLLVDTGYHMQIISNSDTGQYLSQ